MGVHVDEAWRDHQAPDIDLSSGSSGRHPPDGDDPVVADRQVAAIPRVAGAVDDLAAAKHQIISRLVGRGRFAGEQDGDSR
jgi:hypothetical protein